VLHTVQGAVAPHSHESTIAETVEEQSGSISQTQPVESQSGHSSSAERGAFADRALRRLSAAGAIRFWLMSTNVLRRRNVRESVPNDPARRSAEISSTVALCVMDNLASTAA
jgi:hypothetical protein